MDDPLIGSRVGTGDRILIIRKIGLGGSGTIYEGHDEKRDRAVALKFLHEGFSGEEVLLARFQQEGRRFGKLRHEHLVRVHGWGQTGGRLFIVTEFVAGKNLYEHLVDEGPMPINRALRIIRQTASGLAEAHRQDIVHRDLKPENIMLRSRDLAVKVLDFGIAKDLKSRLNLTGLGMYIGTPAYSAPEQIRGEPLDGRADIFALGVILYELLTGKVAFDGRHSTEILRATLREEPRDVSELNRRVTRPVAQLLSAMIAKNRDARVASMEEVMLEVDDLLTHAEDVSQRDSETVAHDLRSWFE